MAACLKGLYMIQFSGLCIFRACALLNGCGFRVNAVWQCKNLLSCSRGASDIILICSTSFICSTSWRLGQKRSQVGLYSQTSPLVRRLLRMSDRPLQINIKEGTWSNSCHLGKPPNHDSWSGSHTQQLTPHLCITWCWRSGTNYSVPPITWQTSCFATTLWCPRWWVDRSNVYTHRWH